MVAVFAADSTTSPEKTAFLGITVPFSKVATSSRARILVPAEVLPALTSCCIVTGNSITLGVAAVAGLCWPSKVAEETAQSTKVDTAIVRVDIDVHPPLLLEAATLKKLACFLERQRSHGQSIPRLSRRKTRLSNAKKCQTSRYDIDFLLDNGGRGDVIP